MRALLRKQLINTHGPERTIFLSMDTFSLTCPVYPRRDAPMSTLHKRFLPSQLSNTKPNTIF